MDCTGVKGTMVDHDKVHIWLLRTWSYKTLGIQRSGNILIS